MGAGGGKSFKAFPRLGDLNQVLCSKNTGGTAYWPWTLAVAKAANTAAGEQNLKFDWQPVKKNLATDWSPGSLGSTSDLSRCANLFCVGGPWNDGIDNDGDGFTDSCNNNQAAKPDTGLKDDGSRFSGPELRVQGKINLNTATGLTLQCLESSLGMPSNTLQTGTGGPNTMKWANARPMLSPTWILAAMTGGGGSTALLAKGDSAAAGAVLTDANSKGWVEDRDWWWTLMSNMVTIRSDTFSVYGTVEVVEPSGASGSVSLRGVRMRHFWALIDRSPTLAFPPVMATPANATGPNFIHPRIMNFQWID